MLTVFECHAFVYSFSNLICSTHPSMTTFIYIEQFASLPYGTLICEQSKSTHLNLNVCIFIFVPKVTAFVYEISLGKTVLTSL